MITMLRILTVFFVYLLAFMILGEETVEENIYGIFVGVVITNIVLFIDGIVKEFKS